jgi:hypothetical protein
MCDNCLKTFRGKVVLGELEAAKEALQRIAKLKKVGKYGGELLGFEERVQNAQKSVNLLKSEVHITK